MCRSSLDKPHTKSKVPIKLQIMRLTILRRLLRISPISAKPSKLLNLRKWRATPLLIISRWLANSFKLAVSDVSRRLAVFVHDCVLVAFATVTGSIGLEVDVLVGGAALGGEMGVVDSRVDGDRSGGADEL